MIDLNVNDPSPSGYNFNKPSLAVIVSNGNNGMVIWWVGGHLWAEVVEAGLFHTTDLGLEEPSAGVWIWEGVYKVGRGSYEHPYDVDTWPEGKWRKPTDEEWLAIKEGRNPWDDKDWMVPEYRAELERKGSDCEE